MSTAPPDVGGFGFGAPVPVSGDLADYETRFGGPLMDTGFGHPFGGSSQWEGYYTAPVPPAPGGPPSFGSIPRIPAEWLPVEFRVLPDDGGTLLELWGTWDEPAYRVRYAANPGGTLYPTDGYAYSAMPGTPYDIVPTVAGELLRVVLPALPVGSYDIVLYWGAYWGASYTANGEDGLGAIDVIRRTRQQAVYRLRSQLPPLWTTGPRTQAEEDLL